MIEIVPVKISEHFDETRKLSALHWRDVALPFLNRAKTRSLWLGVLDLILIEWLSIIFLPLNLFGRLNVRSGGFILTKGIDSRSCFARAY